MSDGNSSKKVETTLKWIIEVASPVPPPEFFESITQSLAIFREINRKSIQTNDLNLIKIAVAGWIASKIRVLDEDKFLEISPYIYLRAAQHIVQVQWKYGDDTETEYYSFIEDVIV